MARVPRLYVDGCAQHIIQRGNNRTACFFSEADYAFYAERLNEIKVSDPLILDSLGVLHNAILGAKL